MVSVSTPGAEEYDESTSQHDNQTSTWGALAPFTVVVLVLGIMLFQYYESIPVELAGNLRFEITIVYLPIMYLALTVFGLAWAPFGAFISSRFASGTAPRRPTSYPRTKQMDLRACQRNGVTMT